MPPFPYPVRIGRPVDHQSGAVRPITVSRGTHYLPGHAAYASCCYQHWDALLAISRVMVVSSRTGEQNWKRKGEAALLPHA